MSVETQLTVVKGDITLQKVDAIVNAANSGLRVGGGVDGAIHRAAGPDLLRECIEIRTGCPTGSAVITGAGNLTAKHVIHAVGPVWRGGESGEAGRLASAYEKSLELAISHRCKSVAFPCISTGVYKYPKEAACKLAIGTVTSYCKAHPGISEVRFVVFSDEDLHLYQEELAKL